MTSCELLPSLQVDFMTSQLSYFHLGGIMLRDAEPHINGLYAVLEVGALYANPEYEPTPTLSMSPP